jgi:phosphoenolpyruvate-protein phosphotransferase
MTQWYGKSVSPGYAEGRAFLPQVTLGTPEPPSHIEGNQVDSEITRFEHAIKRSLREVENLRDRVLLELGDAESSCIFDSHLDLLRDPEFIKKIKQRVREDLLKVDHAVLEQINALKDSLQKAENRYLRERTQDIQDIGNRLLKNLQYPYCGQFSLLKNLPPQTVLVAKEIFPSDTIELDKKNTIAIVTERGGVSSHAAILARSLGIPSITGIKDITKHVSTGDWLLVDAQEGVVTLTPRKDQSSHFSKHKAQYTRAYQAEVREEVQKCQTTDAVTIDLFGNISLLEEIDLIRQHYLKGVGLFRTEYLFMISDRQPTLEQQRTFYQQAVKRLDGLPITFRTLDLGGDKTPLFVDRSFEFHPHMGFRGLRYSLIEKALFNTQLRAILTSGPLANVQIMFPMVLGYDDLREACDIVTQIADDEGIQQLPRIGAMIETPSAIFQIDEILELVDFVSIGTNDLIQFMLASDRNQLDLSNRISPFHPSVIKAIHRIVSEATKKNKGVSICGESAGDPETVGLFVGLGVNQLSMSPLRAAVVSNILRRSSYKDLKKIAMESLNCRKLQEVKALFSTLLAS